MFENSIGNAATTAHLQSLLQQHALPQAVLLSGERYSGKLTLALETARALMCSNPAAPWGCTCQSCEQHRRLSHPQLLLMGNRSFTEELSAAHAALQREPGVGTRYLFGRAVQKLMNRFNPVLWEGEERRLSAAASHIEAVLELVESIFPATLSAAKQTKTADPDKLVRTADTIYQKSLAVLDKVPKDLLTADAIRRMNFWVHISFQNSAKVIILEHVENLNDSQRNLLLKILEEPPQGVYFLLTTSKRSAIMPTILSRVRTVQLERRSAADEKLVLSRVFRVAENEIPADRPLLEFFRRTTCKSPGQMKAAATRWAQHLIGIDAQPQGIPEEDLPGIADTSGAAQREAGVMLLRLIVESLQERFRQDVDGADLSPEQIIRFRQVLKDIDQAVHAVQELNMNAAQVLEGLWFRQNSFV
ncbi:hypothetical protein [Spirochaeta africana]|uniref:DNA polymerase III, gamma/tau subunit n=1 Tax=Spirochaeta africana (strain ATCC 700263 / DSM 8902 / Z-7692) TaxID=889378 RepID=H9UGP8_SPIAZ|nr:hypothetical protein [Spirochaeta africana]AFG36691.1 hypothetical protein Spiaf_0590 [Spirochaeta africana DSM 8902]